MTQNENHVVNEDTEDIENQGYVMVQVQDYVAAGRGRRNSQKSAGLTINMTVAYALSLIEDAISSTYKEVEISSEFEMWKEVILEGMNYFQKNDTWEFSELPKRKKASGCKWLYVKKQGSHNGATVRYKARMVAKDYSHGEGIDYNEVFSPVVKHSSIRILLALVT